MWRSWTQMRRLIFLEQKFEVENIKKKTDGNRCKPKIALKIRCFRKCTIIIDQGML